VFANLFIKIIFLFKQTIIEIDTQIKLIEKNKMGKKHHARLHILEILSKNNFFIFKNKVHPYKKIKKYIDESQKLFEIKCITKKIIIV
jgi:hypothetical protein